ncbi:MAG: DUF2330 domain-containing protein [Acidobacteria bacterium]|nr:DUF2330 domain-containing protein [Acidobacteriota bacterium]
MNRRLSILGSLALVLPLLLMPSAARAFCGFYVARADTGLYNQASQVVLVRDGDRTVITMVSDVSGAPEEFAMVVPVPTFLERDQIHVTDKAIVDQLDAYSSPRLVEYHDSDPCARYEADRMLMESAAPAAPMSRKVPSAQALGVTIEASYTVGEYDILILSAKQSDGLVTWLKSEGYRLPKGAEPVVASYLKQGMRFFVAKVNLEEQAKLGYQTLRPLQMAFESRRFMLPIRLGTVNADGPQELFVYTLTRTGRVETTNYRTVKLPTGMDLPVFVKDDFGRFYKDMFAHQVEAENRRAVFVEYAWDMAWCDPCAADPLTPQQLSELGVFWLDSRAVGPAQNVFITRLHLSYDRDHFPEDLMFQETGNRENFQGRYVMRHPWTGNATCSAADDYRRELSDRRRRDALELARLTGWSVADIERRQGPGTKIPDPQPWWKRLWGG